MVCTSEELSEILDREVAAILDEAEVRRMPVDILRVAKRLNLVVTIDDRQVGRARFVRFSSDRDPKGQGSIVVRSDPRPERLQWAVGHEIGETRAEHVFAALGWDPAEVRPTMREKVANQLANRLLLPTDWFRRETARCNWHLFALKKKFSTASHELIARRMLDFEPPIVITIIDNGAVTTRQSNVPGQVPSMSAEERACWQKAHHTVRMQTAGSSQGTIQVWPVHEPHWQREIVRWELSLGEYFL